MSKRKHHSRKRRSRRRVGALNLQSKDTGLKLLSLAGGFLMGDSINNAIDSAYQKMQGTPTGGAVATSVPNTPIAIGEIGIGGLLLMRKKSGGVNTALKVGGGVLAGAGIRRFLKSMGVMKGYQAVPVIGRHRMTGYQSVPVIGGTPPQLSGSRPAQLQGYRVNGYIPHGSGVMGNADGGSGITTSTGSGYMS